MVRIVRLTVPTADAEIAADRLWALGAPAVGEEAGPDGGVVLVTELVGPARAELQALSAGWRLDVVDVDADAALDAWRAHAGAVEAGRIVVVPAWQPPPAGASGVVVTVDPGRAFGFAHATTRLCLRAIDRLVGPGTTVLDVGSGSGVLAVAAARLGARVDAVDTDPVAVDATRANARRNDVRVRVALGSTEAVDGPYDVVVANLLAPALVDRAADLDRLAAGPLVVSGLLAGRYAHVVDAIGRPVVRVDEDDGWVALQLERGTGVR